MSRSKLRGIKPIEIKLFIEESHKVCSVNSGKKAINLLKTNNYDLLLCDLVMPDMSEKDVIKSLTSLSNRPKVRLITGWRHKIEDAEKDGLEIDFIVKKPFNLSK
ncbi:MAG: response regulator [Candidatus Scalindua sp.]|nr:response regulator [Candidatus Scalindua sp.]MBT6047595.1 response regulator [Candidatus Scalindua sp.]MBT6225691.1 response regulator [Candidatus Scalindua sp.]MBT6562327.1 response regulator [Candidatus Scalindua sp.]MBT7212260.1 response regulator [Candidatus Scalindua sp.]